MMTFKELREATEAIGAVTNREKLIKALPVIVECEKRIKSMRKTMDEIAALVGKLNESASNYVLAHESVLDDGFYLDAKGVKSGDITIEDEKVIYHFSAGYATPKRIDGDAMSQEFLDELPKEWTQSYKKIYATGIKEAKVTQEQLEAKGLYRPAKNEWSVKEAPVFE